MGWETDSDEVILCECGAGTVRVQHRSNDSGKFETRQTFNCAECQARSDEKQRRRQKDLDDRAELLSAINQLAAERYLEPWLSLFKGKTVPDAWRIYTDERRFPLSARFASTSRLRVA